MRKFTKERAQRLRVPGVEIDEDEALPHLALDRRNAAVAGVKVEQEILARRRHQLAVEFISPAVEAAIQQRRLTLDFLERIVAPEQLVDAVRADVVERAQHIVLATHHEHGGVEELELTRSEAQTSYIQSLLRLSY